MCPAFSEHASGLMTGQTVLPIPEPSDSCSDYDPRFQQTTRDGLRLVPKSKLQERDFLGPPQTKPACMAQCRLA